MKIVLAGKNDAAVEVLDFLLAKGADVWVVGVAGDDGRDGWQRSLRAAAERRGVRFDQPRKPNEPDFVRRLAAFAPEVFVSIQYDRILRAPLLDGIGCPCLNLHFALLPRHRGVAPIAWAVCAGDTQAGVTLHHMVEDIDAGDVVARLAVPIAPDDTAREVYDNVSRATVALFARSYPFPPALLATRLPQDPGAAVYHKPGDFDFSHNRIDWDRPALELHRWLRAMIFPPHQYPTARLNGRELAVTRLDGIIGAPALAAPGVVVGRSTRGIDVAAADGVIRIVGLIDPARSGEPAVAVGDRLA